MEQVNITLSRGFSSGLVTVLEQSGRTREAEDVTKIRR